MVLVLNYVDLVLQLNVTNQRIDCKYQETKLVLHGVKCAFAFALLKPMVKEFYDMIT